MSPKNRREPSSSNSQGDSQISPGLEQGITDIEFRTHFMWSAMQYACLPLVCHKLALEQHYREKFEEAYEGPLSPDVLKSHLAFLSCYRTMLGRSVQPRGTLRNLAPIIGAIRLKDRSAGQASEYLAPRIVNAWAEGDSEFVNEVKKLSRAPLGKSREYQIWVAVFELRNSGEFGTSRILKEAGQYRLFPNTKEVKDYISLLGNVGAERFDDLPVDESTLDVLMKRSGVKMFVENAVRGKKANRH